MNQTINAENDAAEAALKFRDLLDIRSKAGHTPFFVSIVRGHLEIADLLLADGMSCIDFEDEESDTPLHWAVILNKPDTVRFLLERNADKTIQNRNQNSCLMVACLNGNL